MRIFEVCLLGLVSLVSVSSGAVKTGPDIGEKIPAFSAPDQNGKVQTLATVTGPKGAMLVFFRSADW